MNSKCQVFTPSTVAQQMLDKVGYVEELYGKKIIENACGDGNILIEIVRRYIEVCLKEKYTIDEITRGLHTDIYGIELDQKHFINCIYNLNVLAAGYEIYNVQWNIINGDALKENFSIQFDFVIGNPPYINHRELDRDTREFLKNNFHSCRLGKFDYCYAFIEASINLLGDKGKMAYLVPNNIFKNVFGHSLREIMKADITKIYDYTSIKLFDNVLTSSAILIIDKKTKSNNFFYIDILNNRTLEINKNDLNEKWQFKSKTGDKLVTSRFGDYFTASICVATLLNKAFILKDFELDNEYYRKGNHKIEKAIVRDAASPRTKGLNKKENILFPYRYSNNDLVKFTSEEFAMKFPEATKYLKRYMKELKERNADKNAEWFEYGRSQALAHLNQKKLLLSTIVTKKVNVHHLNRNEIPYSGIYIISKGDNDLNTAKSILESEEFLEYVNSIGIHANGKSLRITVKDINNFEIKTNS